MQKKKSKPPFLWKERYIHADGYIKCDGCGEEKAISKGVTYLEHIAHDEDGNEQSVMRFCPRCIFAIKARQAATKGDFEIRRGDLEYDKLNNRFKAAWMRLRQRITKSIKDGVQPNDAWHDAAEKLVDELGMRHLYERDLMLSKQAEQFSSAIKEIDRENAKLQKRLKSVKKELETCVDGAAKAQFALKVEIQKRGGMDDMLDKFETLVASICKLRDAITKI